MIQRKIYLASSWRNPLQPQAVQMLRNAGHEVYDFRNPTPGNTGFAWSDIDPDWLRWTPERFIAALAHPIAAHGYSFDKTALDWCDTCVLLLPCGKSAHLEAGYAIGQGKPTLVVLHDDLFEPELMYLLAGSPACVVSDLSRMLKGLDALPAGESHLERIAELEQQLADAQTLAADSIHTQCLLEAVRENANKDKARAEDAEAERDWLAELAAKFSEYGACEVCPAAGVTCTEGDCAEDLLKMAAAVTARREGGAQ